MRRLASVYLLVAGLTGLTLAVADEGPTLTRTEVLSYKEKNVATWLSRVEQDKVRVCYTEKQWPQEIARILSLQGKGAEWRQLLHDSAERLANTPIPLYRSPEQMPNALNAREEGWERSFGNQLICLALATKLWPEARFRTALHDRTLAACRFETWGRNGKRAEWTNMDLAAGHVLVGVAVAYDWGRDVFTKEEKAFIRDVVAARGHQMLEGLYGAVFWSNWYSQNHNHISVAGLGVAGLAFLDEIPEAPEWLAAASLNFQRAVATMAADGSSYEGIGYWGYGRTAIVEFIEAARAVAGTGSLYEAASLRNAADFRVACSTPGFDGVLLWADSRGHDVSGPQHLLARFAAQYHLPQAQYAAEQINSAPMAGTWALPWLLLWYDPKVVAEPSRQLDYHAANMDVVTSRSGWGEGDYLLTIKSGVNRYHHTHLDAGSIALNFGGTWLLMAPGYGMGVGKDKFFDMNGGRWDYFSASSESHSTLRINGKIQRWDKDARGTIDHFVSAPSLSWTEVNLNEAYENVKSVRRRVVHRRGDYALVLDEVSNDGPTTVEWLAQVPPRTKLDRNTLSVSALRGSLTISMLGNAAPFTDYKPTAKFIDVAAERMKTVASQNTGDDVKLAAMLAPHFEGQSDVALKPSFESSPKGSHTKVDGGHWQDEIWTGAWPGSAPYAEINTLSGAVAVRHVEKKLQAITAIETTRLHFNGIEVAATAPTDLSIEDIAPGVHLLTTSKALACDISLPRGARLVSDSDAQLTAGKINLTPGRYWILDEKVDMKQAQAALTALFPPRPAPQPFPVTTANKDLEKVPSSVAIHWEAETAAQQQGGLSPIKSLPGASGGKAIDSFGLESSSHSIGWKVTVPLDGIYYLKLRYAMGQPKAHLVLLVDGKAPGTRTLSAVLNGPAGWGEEIVWSVENHDWIIAVLSDAHGALPIPLTKGEHEIRLAAPTEGLNLDYLELVGEDAANTSRSAL